MRGEGRRQLRCAVYTRKSTEEGLEQDFNSLDAQFEACAAYISSQRHEGWSLVKERYDDGGYSGGSLDRPGLRRLLADVEARRVDIIVVYKVDRLTRSLSDFAKIVEVLDSREASFVSITQSFNTTTSMGRLTLNVLLSFAQFEREVIAERVRDKVAASRRKGIWMGGSPPLGYEVRDRKLVVNEGEAELVRHIFKRYVDLGCGRLLLQELKEQGVRTKVRADRGGVPFARGSLFYLLNNRTYLGEARHHDRWYPGEQDSIIDPRTWDAVQAALQRSRTAEALSKARTRTSVLAGRLMDEQGRRMVPSHAKRRGRDYRYYVTVSDLLTPSSPATRVPAWDLERAVRERITKFLRSQAELRDQLRIVDASEVGRLAALAAEFLANGGDVLRLAERVQVASVALTVDVNTEVLAAALQLPEPVVSPITLWANAARVRHGKEVKLLLQADPEHSPIHPNLGALLKEAAEAKQLVEAVPGGTLSSIATRQGRCRTYLGKLYRIAHLSPEIVEMIMSGKQPAHLTTRLLLSTQLPADWSEQVRLFRLS